MKLHHIPLAATLLALCSVAQADYPSFSAMALPLPATGDSMQWTGLNDYGQLIGNSAQQARLWTPQTANGLSGVFTTLGNATALDINNWGEVLGSGSTFRGTDLWRPGVANGTVGAFAPVIPNFAGLSMNDAGQILGRRDGSVFPVVLTPGSAGHTESEIRTYDNLLSRINQYGQVVSVDSGISDAGDELYVNAQLFTPTSANATSYTSSGFRIITLPVFLPGDESIAARGVALSQSGAVSVAAQRCQGGGYCGESVQAAFTPSAPNGTTGSVGNGGFDGPESNLHYVTGDNFLATKRSTAAAVPIDSLLDGRSAAAFEAQGLNVESIIDMNSAGQMLALVGEGGLPHFYLLTPTGASADLPLLPGSQLPALGGGTTFEFAVTVQGSALGNVRYFFDPPVAVGYEYESQSGPSFASVLLPNVGDGKYRLELWSGSAWVDAGVELEAGVSFDFLAGVSADGVRKFRILGIETDVALAPSDPNAFVTGLTFNGSGELKLTQTSLTVNVPIPEPSTYTMFALGLALLCADSRRRERRL